MHNSQFTLYAHYKPMTAKVTIKQVWHDGVLAVIDKKVMLS